MSSPLSWWHHLPCPPPGAPRPRPGSPSQSCPRTVRACSSRRGGWTRNRRSPPPCGCGRGGAGAGRGRPWCHWTRARVMWGEFPALSAILCTAVTSLQCTPQCRSPYRECRAATDVVSADGRTRHGAAPRRHAADQDPATTLGTWGGLISGGQWDALQYYVRPPHLCPNIISTTQLCLPYPAILGTISEGWEQNGWLIRMPITAGQ